MNIIALSLGLAPVPALPPETQRRRHTSEQRYVRTTGRIGPGFKAEIVAMLRETGPATTNEIADFFGQAMEPVKIRVALLQDAGEIRCCGRHSKSRARVWEAV